MGITVKTTKGIRYLYFQAGNESIYLGPEGNPAKAKPDNVARALDYAIGRADHYVETLEVLLPLLPARDRGRYASKELARLQGRLVRCASKSQK